MRGDATKTVPLDRLEHDWGDRLRKGIWPKSKVFWISMVYLALFIIRPWEGLFPELGEWRFERIVGLSMVALLALTQTWKWRGGLQAAAVLAFFFVMLLSGRLAYQPILSEPDVTEFVSILISFFVLLFIVKTPYQLLVAVTCYIVTTAVYVSKSEWEYFVNNGAQYAMGVRRLAGIDFTYGHPNAVAASILFSLPFAYFLYTMRDDFSRTWPRRYQRWFPRCLWAFGLVGLLGVFLTRSRGGVVGLVALVVLMAMREGRLQAKVRRLVIVGCLLGAVFVCLPRDMQGRIQTIWDSSVEHDGEHKGAHTSALGRYYGFLRGMDMFRRYPVLGVGLGNYKQYRVDKLDGVYLSAHNLVGELLGETGILGGVSFLLVLVALGCNLRRIRRQLRDDDPAHPEVRALLGLRRACGDAVLLMLLQGLIGHNLQRYNWFWIAAFAWLAAHFAAQRRTRRVAEELQGVDAEYLETSPSLALTRV